MIPQTILRNLARLRRRERMLALAWGAALWASMVLAALMLACLVDWLIDRERDTPWAIRCLMLAALLSVAMAAGYLFLLRPQGRRLDDDTLALWVEAGTPGLSHRLITAVQLTRPGANREGMSEELIGVVAHEAERRCSTMQFAAIADHGRLRRAAWIAGPALVAAALPFLLFPHLAAVLVARQFLADVDIPHSVAIEPLKFEDVRPAGEKVALQFRVRSAELDPAWIGTAYVTPQGQPGDRYALTFARWDGDDAIFESAVAPSSVDLIYTARLGDGRMRRPGLVAIVPRPIVQEQLAWVQLPAFCGLRPDGRRYEQPQSRGDIVGIPESAARLVVKVQKPVRRAWLDILGRESADSSNDPVASGEVCKRRVELELHVGGVTAEGAFDLRADETAYRVVVADEYGFENVPPPRRGLRLVAEEPPQVALLKEHMPPLGATSLGGAADDHVVDGLPVVPGKKIRVAYVAHGPFGLGRARFLYRILRKTESGVDEPKEEPWRSLDLPEIKAGPKSGAFDPTRGAFEHSPFEEIIYFHAAPSLDPDQVLGRTLGGGRFDFATSGIPDRLGGFVPLRVGDQFEFCVEVFADADPKRNRPSARSEVRVRPVISDDELFRWLADAYQEEQRLKELDKKQRGVFELRY
jgi:hypothetical protein